jgi:hypothetical protein
MKNIYSLFILSFISLLSFGQTLENTGLNILTKDNEIIQAEKILYSTKTDLYFTLSGTQTCYKIPLELVLKSDHFGKELTSTDFSYYLSKFVSKSQTGITFQIIGAFGSIILPLAEAPIVLLALPPIIGVTGWIIWVSSYKALKQYATINGAIVWINPVEINNSESINAQNFISPKKEALSSKEILTNLNEGLSNNKVNLSKYDNSYNVPTVGDYVIFQTETSDKQVGRILSIDCNNKNCDCLIEILSQNGDVSNVTIKHKNLLGIAYL